MDAHKLRKELEKGKSIFELPLRVVYYARVSTDKDDQLNSLSNQTAYYEKYIRENSCWQFCGAYIDEGVSGTSVERRDSFLRMIGDAENGKFDLIVTKEISRFSRNTLDSIAYTRRLLGCGVGVYFQNDNINTLSGDAELRLTIMASLAQDEVRRLSERVKFGFRQAQEKGIVLGNDNTYGYRKRDGKLEIDEAEAQVVREIFRRYTQGRDGLRRIAIALEADGITAPNGRMFGYSTLCGIIRNPKYKGYYTAHKYETDDYRTHRVRKLDRSEWLCVRDEAIPAIVDEATWDKANRLLDERGERLRNMDGGSFSSRYRYSGKLICAEHDTAFHRHVMKNRSGERECWSCRIYRLKGKAACDSPTIYSDELDEIFAKIFNDAAKNSERIAADLAEMYTLKTEDRDTAPLEAELIRIKKKRDKLLDLAVDGMITNSEFRDRNDALTAREGDLEAELKKIKAAASTETDLRERAERLREYLTETVRDSKLVSGEAVDVLLDHIRVKRISRDETELKIILKSDISDGLRAVGKINTHGGILSYETGISQAQVSRLEKGALERIRKQLI